MATRKTRSSLSVRRKNATAKKSTAVIERKVKAKISGNSGKGKMRHITTNGTLCQPGLLWNLDIEQSSS